MPLAVATHLVRRIETAKLDKAGCQAESGHRRVVGPSTRRQAKRAASGHIRHGRETATLAENSTVVPTASPQARPRRHPRCREASFIDDSPFARAPRRHVQRSPAAMRHRSSIVRTAPGRARRGSDSWAVRLAIAAPPRSLVEASCRAGSDGRRSPYSYGRDHPSNGRKSESSVADTRRSRQGSHASPAAWGRTHPGSACTGTRRPHPARPPIPAIAVHRAKAAAVVALFARLHQAQHHTDVAVEQTAKLGITLGGIKVAGIAAGRRSPSYAQSCENGLRVILEQPPRARLRCGSSGPASNQTDFGDCGIR